MSDHQQQADKLYNSGRFAEAMAAYKQALHTQSNNPQLLQKIATLALWENNTEQALVYLQQAVQQTGWWGQRWPMSAQLSYRLGSAYFRADDYANAAEWYKRAAGPLAVGPLKPLRAMQMQAEAFGDTRPYQISGTKQANLPFIMLDPLPVVEIYLNDNGPYSFFIDTGGTDLMLGPQVARELGLEIYAEFSGSFAAGKSASIGVSRLDSVELGKIRINNLPVHTLALEGIDELFGRRIHGAIGTSLLRHFHSTIDYAGGQLILRQINVESEKEMTALAQTATVIPFWLIEQHMMMAHGRINELPETLFFVDTGLANRGFLISHTSARTAGLALNWSQAEQVAGGGGTFNELHFELDRISLGSGEAIVTQQPVKASIHEKDLPTFTGALGFEVGGLISHDFFRARRLTMDFRRMQLLIEESPPH